MSDDSSRRILDYYDDYDEWSRLETPRGRLEFERMLALLEAELADASRVLDLGGGPGRYTIELARRGHRPTLVDLSAKHVELARRHLRQEGLRDSVEGLRQGNAVDLGAFDAESFDAVLAAGPFYHLVDPSDRQAAAREVARVLRPGGLAFVQFMPRLSGLVRMLVRASRAPEQVSEETLSEVRRTGRFRNASDEGFQEGWYPQPAAVDTLLSKAGLEVQRMESLRGLAAFHEEALDGLRDDEPALSEAFRQIIDETADHPAVIATGQIAVAIAKREPLEGV